MLLLVVVVFIIPHTGGILNKNSKFKNISEVRNYPEISNLNYYTIGEYEFRIELIYEIGKEVQKWDYKKKPSFPENKSFVVISTEDPNDLFSEDQKKDMKLSIIDHFDNNKQRAGKRRNKEHFKKYVSIVTPLNNDQNIVSR